MSNTKLSYRAQLLLRVVDNCSDVEWSTGEVRRVFTPSEGTFYVTGPKGDDVRVHVSGSVAAAALKALESRGLIASRKLGLPLHCYVITEAGRAMIERGWDLR